jgi:diguanylate cyclase (GGDEF)-like protein
MPDAGNQSAALRRPIAMLLVAAAGTVLFASGGGLLLYWNTQRLTDSAQRVQHTDETLSVLQRASLLAERIDYRSRLYALTGDEDQLRRAQTAANALTVTAEHLAVLVADNRNQAANVDNLKSCSASLSEAVDRLSQRSSLPQDALGLCQKTVGLMTDQEQLLLTARTQRSQQNLSASVIAEVLLAALSIAVLITLFALLIRDILQRQRFTTETRNMNERLGETIQALEDQASQSTLLSSARDEIQLCLSVDQVYQAAANTFCRLLPGTSGSLCMMDNARRVVEMVAGWGESAIQDNFSAEACCGLRLGQARWRLPGSSEVHCSHFAVTPPERYLCRPIIAHGETLGVCYVQCETDLVVQSVVGHSDGLRHLVQIVGLAIATLNLQSKLENQSIRDPLTGLFNRRFMELSMERELARAARRKQITAVLMIDLDHFKQFNDRHGHPAGDAALKAIAEVLTENIRAEDVACRYGGEEFAVILPETALDGARERAESILDAIRKVRFRFGNETREGFTASAGLAFFPVDGHTSELLFRRADAALYRAKDLGRNQLVLYEAPEEIV